MEETRRKSIDELVKKLKEEHSLENLDSLKKIARDRKINVIESNRVIVPFSYKQDNKYYIGVDTSLFKKVSEYHFKHEL